MSLGLPVITTSIGAEGMDLKMENALIALFRGALSPLKNFQKIKFCGRTYQKREEIC